MSMHIVPLAFAANRLTTIDDAGRRLDSEAELFREIRELLTRYGVEQKYGLTLLHKHFDLADDEVLMEYADVENRTLTTRPAPRSEASAVNAVETVWSVDSGLTMMVCRGFCYYYPSTGKHVAKHEVKSE
jgi:hypothetical protein